jgi:hypothetical protein
VDKRGKRHMEWVKAQKTLVWIPSLNIMKKAPEQAGLEGLDY